MPRHPPYALNNLTNTQNSTLDKNRTHHLRKSSAPGKDARVHCAVLNQQTATGHHTTASPGTPRAVRQPDRPRHKKATSAPSGPNSVPTTPELPRSPVSTHPLSEDRRCSTRGRQTSRRPNWSAFHPRAPPRRRGTPPDGDSSCPDVALDRIA